MVKIVITQRNGSTINNHFDDRAACDKWLAEEMTRPYWQVDSVVEVFDNTEEEAAADKIRLDAATLKLQMKKSIIEESKKLDLEKIKDPDVKLALKLLFDYISNS